MKLGWIVGIILSIFIITGTVFAGVSIKEHVVQEIPKKESYVQFDQLDPQKQNFIDQLKLNREEAVFEAQKKVVQIETSIGKIGSGFLYNMNGDIVTNAHVVANASEVTVISAESSKYKGTVIGISEETDIAVIRVAELAGREPLAIETEARSEILDPVLALGSPLGFQNTVTAGEVNAIDRSFKIEPFHYKNIDQVSAAISPGNSGGPLLNAETMKVIGINSAEDPEKNVGYSIPIMDVMGQINSWVDTPLETLPTFDQYAQQPNEAVIPSYEDRALYLVEYYYSLLQFGDLVTAYSMMGSSYQQENRYEAFRERFQNVTAVSLESTETFLVAGQVEVRATVQLEELEENMQKNRTYEYTFIIGSENDQLKIKRMERQ